MLGGKRITIFASQNQFCIGTVQGTRDFKLYHNFSKTRVGTHHKILQRKLPSEYFGRCAFMMSRLKTSQT